MLVVISDLHFTDGTTSTFREDDGVMKDLFNVSPEAFRLFFSMVHDAARRKGTVEEVTFVFAGDIFDLLRTYYWFDVDAGEQPWGVPLREDAVCEHARKILAAAIRYNRGSLDWLSGKSEGFAQIWDDSIRVKRVYLPGNHDRLVNLDEGCRRLVRESLLGGPASDAPFASRHEDERHDTLVMHGHETDRLNCEFSRDGSVAYGDVPVGDPITTMLVARAGYEAGKLDISEAARDRFRNLDNVRPSLAVIRFIQDIIRDFDIKDEVEGMMSAIVDDFSRLPFYSQWLDRHDRMSLRPDEADRMELLLMALRAFGSDLHAGLAELGERLRGLVKPDGVCEEWACRMLGSMPSAGPAHVVLGHTHAPDHVPLRVDPGTDRERHYLNAGTFRTTFMKTHENDEFLQLQRLSYVVIYAPGEVRNKNEGPLYEMWSGLRRQY